LKSKVLSKVVHISDSNDVCFCDNGFYKTCVARIANNLVCQESLIRITPVSRDLSDDDGYGPGDDLCRANSEFKKTLKHLDRMKF